MANSQQAVALRLVVTGRTQRMREAPPRDCVHKFCGMSAAAASAEPTSQEVAAVMLHIAHRCTPEA